MIRTVLLGLTGIVAVLVVVVALQPSAFHIARTASISAPASTVFAQVNDFRNWEAWSPWEGIDPTMKRNYEGPPELGQFTRGQATIRSEKDA